MARPPGPPAPARLRIESIALTDFRAFAGPGATVIPFGRDRKTDCNVLLYGENGAGKSSLFEALRGLFARRPKRRFFRNERNVFSQAPASTAKVEVRFNDALDPALWTVAQHPGKGSVADPRVVQTAQRAAMLDYRALLDTNYGQGEGEPNLFTIAVDRLLHDYPLAGGGLLGETWEAVGAAKPLIYGYSLAGVQAACASFNAEFAAAITALLPFTRTILRDLLGDAVVLTDLEYGTVRYVNAYQKRDRIIADQLLQPKVEYRAHPMARPQFFLNEARQSALALAIYLGSRLACTQSAPATAPKLLVLDDLLIGLDQSNRLPVLNVLRDHFADWQIILLTHDRTWFEMARAHLEPASDWAYLELHDGSDGAGPATPIVRLVAPTAPDQALDQAQRFLNDGHLAAAATYARTAFELGLRQWAEKGSIKLRFRNNPGDLTSQELINGIKAEKGTDPRSDAARVLVQLELFRTVVLNPLSHATPPGIQKSEVQGAITAVRFMLSVSRQR